MYDKSNLQKPYKEINPIFNRCVMFNITSESYQGHPKPLICPKNTFRKSIALQYYLAGRSIEERNDSHSTIFRSAFGEKSTTYLNKTKKFFKYLSPNFI